MRPQSTASLVIVVPGRVLAVSMALMTELTLRRFGGGDPRIGLLGSPRLRSAVEQALTALLLCSRPPTTGDTILPREWQVTGWGRGALTKHPPSVLAQDAGQVLLALGALVPVWDNH